MKDSRTQIQKAVAHLMETARGRDAIVRIHAWMDDLGLGLDSMNQEAVVTVLGGAWGPYAGTTMDALGEARETIEGVAKGA